MRTGHTTLLMYSCFSQMVERLFCVDFPLSPILPLTKVVFFFSPLYLTCRAYNPRLFRLCNRLEEGDEEEGKAKDKDDKGKNERTEKQKQHAANREKVKDFQKVGHKIRRPRWKSEP